MAKNPGSVFQRRDDISSVVPSYKAATGAGDQRLHIKSRPESFRGTAKPNQDDWKDLHARRAHGFGVLSGMSAYQRHKQYINNYVIHYGGVEGVKEFTKPAGSYKTDKDVLREEYRFIRSVEDNDGSTWEKRVSKKYYDKLFREYCLADMSRYKKGQIGLRWRVEKEVFSGKGQFVCGNKKCKEVMGLHSYEVNFAYKEDAVKKNALIKLRLCPKCGYKLNYKHHKQRRKRKRSESAKQARRDAKRRKSSKRAREDTDSSDDDDDGDDEAAAELNYREERKEQDAPQEDPAEEKEKEEEEVDPEASAREHWMQRPELEKTAEEEYEDFFQGMFP